MLLTHTMLLGCCAGLPETWEQVPGDTDFAAAQFDQGGNFPPVVDNVHLVKGLFSESLPPFLQLQARPSCLNASAIETAAVHGKISKMGTCVLYLQIIIACDVGAAAIVKRSIQVILSDQHRYSSRLSRESAGGCMCDQRQRCICCALQSVWTGKQAHSAVPLSYLHIDCDLYAGAHDAFTLLSHKIVPGTIILFDELVNYQQYRLHEVKAFFEWLQVSGAKVATIGIMGPIEGKEFAMEMDLQVKEHPWWTQSAAFLVVSKPGHSSSHMGL